MRRAVNAGLLDEAGDPLEIGDWVLIHVGFAISRIDKEEARATHEFLLELGDPYRAELADLQQSRIE